MMWTAYQHFAQQHFPQLCRPRPADSHKGTFGTVGIIGGHVGMSGAVIMAARAALKLGAGKVKIGFAQDVLPLPVLEQQPEIMLYTAAELLTHTDINAWAIGCGLHTDARAVAIIRHARSVIAHHPVVWDADALNLFASQPNLQDAVLAHHIITPHPREAARLLHTSTTTIQNDRVTAAKQLHQQLACISVLKGHQTVVISTTDDVYINHTGNAALATAGSGDVLTGIIVSLLAQGIAPAESAAAAVWLHGAAADVMALEAIGSIGMTATELIDAARLLRNRVTESA